MGGNGNASIGKNGPEASIHGCMTLSDSHRNFGPDLLLKVLMFNMHEIWSFDSPKNY